MYIAVGAAADGSVSRHFGRSKSFLVFEVSGERIVCRSERVCPHGACGEHGCGEAGAEIKITHEHSHMVEILQGCDVVLSRGMGWRAAEDLRRHRIEAFILPDQESPEEAVRSFLTGRAAVAVEFCRGHHGHEGSGQGGREN